MSSHSQEPLDLSAVPLRPASTVMLLRDSKHDIEVFMMQRTTTAAFASGMYVFPGGRVDDVDGASELDDLCEGLTDAEASDLLRVPSGGLAYWVAAIRESFEEAGVLLARDERGEFVRQIACRGDRRRGSLGRADQLFVDAARARCERGQLCHQRRAIGQPVKPRDLVEREAALAPGGAG